MSVADALRSAGGLLRRRTNAVLPYYALSAATVDVTRLPLLVGVVVAYLALTSTGQLSPLLDEFAALNPELLGPESPEALPPELGDRLAAVLFSPTVVVPVALAAAVALVVSVLVRGVTRAAALSAVDAGLATRDPLAAGVRGMRRWKTFAGLVVVRWGLLLAAGIPFLAAVVGASATLGATPGMAALGQGAVVAVLAALVGGLVSLLAVVAVVALLAFAGPAAVVDDLGLGAAVRRSAGVPFAHPVGFLLYGVVVVGTYVGLGVGTVLFGIAGVERLVAVTSAFLVSPLLDGVAVALYTDWTDAASRPAETDAESSAAADDDDERVDTGGEADESGFVFGEREPAERRDEDEDEDDTERIAEAVGGALRDGIRELGRFVRTGWYYVVVAAAALLAGVAGGWATTAGSGVRIGTPVDPGSVFGLVPVGPFVNIAVNNWFVASNAGFAGLFAGLPTLGTLVFNGLLVGAVAGVVDPVAFVAFVGPHGVVELPAIAVAGGVGLRLGHVAWGVWRDERPTAALADELGLTWRRVVGLLAVFVVAGFVEAFVTPQVAAAVL